MASRKTRKAAPAAPAASAPTQAAPAVPCVTITYRNATHEVLYQLHAPLIVLLTNAIRAVGLRFATHSHLRLHDQDDTEIPLGGTAAKSGIEPGAQLTLREPDTGA